MFDLLALDGDDIRAWAIEDRKAALEHLLTPAPPGLLYVKHVDAEHGAELHQMAVQIEVEGVVAKRLGSPYQSGVRSDDWVKVKRPGAVPEKRFRI